MHEEQSPIKFIFSLSFFHSLSCRRVVWPWQQGELHRSTTRWHVRLHWLMGQLLEDLELNWTLKQDEKRIRQKGWERGWEMRNSKQQRISLTHTNKHTNVTSVCVGFLEDWILLEYLRGIFNCKNVSYNKHRSAVCVIVKMTISSWQQYFDLKL